MVSPKALQILFATVLVLFVFTLIGHVSSPAENESEYDFDMDGDTGFTTKVADRLKPYFGGAGSLGGIKDHLKRSEVNYQDMVKQRAVLMKDYVNPMDKPL